MEQNICIFLRLVAYEIYVLLLRYAYMLVFSGGDEILVYGCS
jgi:hypothetical protein